MKVHIVHQINCPEWTVIHERKDMVLPPLSPASTYSIGTSMELESLLNKERKQGKWFVSNFLFSYLAIKKCFIISVMRRLHPITMQCQDYCKSDRRCREEINLWRICCFHWRSCKQKGCQRKFEILVCRLSLMMLCSLSSISFRINCRCHFKSNYRRLERKERESKRKCFKNHKQSRFNSRSLIWYRKSNILNFRFHF